MASSLYHEGVIASGSMRSVELVRRWVNACDKYHGSACQPIPVRDQPLAQIPDWVIDTDHFCLVPGFKASQYLALSYVWPKEANLNGAPVANADGLQLRKENLAEFQIPGFLFPPLLFPPLLLNLSGTTALPRSIRDAMMLVDKLGFRYHWVDRLCLVQDDEHTRQKVDMMDEIYAGAYFTIVAATSESIGLPATYRKNKHVNLQHLQSRNAINENYELLFRTRWASRGWTFQEQILSRRCAIFLDELLFWDCQCSLWDDVHLIESSISTSSQLATCTSLKVAIPAWHDFHLYTELACAFNCRELTYPQDALAAFGGILGALGPSFPSGFVGGLPVLFLDSALLWQPFARATRRMRKDGENATRGALPSWSSAGWQCLIDPVSVRTGLEYLWDRKSRAKMGSWRVRKLVDRTFLSADMQEGVKLTETERLNDYNSSAGGTTQRPEPPGWSQHFSPNDPENLKSFVHKSYPQTQFRFPVPVVADGSSAATPPPPPARRDWPLLTCTTSRGFFRVRAILESNGGRTLQSAMKVSIFELADYTEGPDGRNTCSVAVLENRHGRWAGVLRLMDDVFPRLGASGWLELVAISAGEVDTEGLGDAYEESVDKRGEYPFCRGLTNFTFWRVTAGMDPTADRNMTPRRREWMGAKRAPDEGIWASQDAGSDEDLTHGNPVRLSPSKRSSIDYLDDMETDGSLSLYKPNWSYSESLSFVKMDRNKWNGWPEEAAEAREPPTGLSTYHFCNVLWVERKGEIAYRLAAGRVSKEIWDANASGPVRVMLG